MCTRSRQKWQVEPFARLCARILVLWLLSFTGNAETALAQGSEAAPESGPYRMAVERALEEYRLGNFQEARDQFSRAHAIFPNARTLRGLGFTAFELRDYTEAESLLKSALASNIKPLEGDLRTECEEMLARAQGYIGQISLDVEPAQVAIVVDGIHRAEAPGLLQLAVGDHVLEFRARGYVEERRAVRVQGGSIQTLRVSLSPLAAPTTAAADLRDRPRAEPLRKRWWLWTAVGVVLAGGATALAVTLTRNQRTEHRAVPSDHTPAGVGIEALLSQP